MSDSFHEKNYSEITKRPPEETSNISSDGEIDERA